MPRRPARDSDFVVKVIDVFPEDSQSPAWNADDGPDPGQYVKSLNGYELPIAMEVRRGRYLKSFEKAEPLQPYVPVLWNVPLRDRDHVFQKGHRIMVQVQSTWFPIIDRNPQKFVPNINQATKEDFVKATQRVQSFADHAVFYRAARDRRRCRPLSFKRRRCSKEKPLNKPNLGMNRHAETEDRDYS